MQELGFRLRQWRPDRDGEWIGGGSARFDRRNCGPHKLPAVYNYRGFVDAGGLISYGADPVDQFRLAASYPDRVLQGEKPADLPVQASTMYELVINLGTAKALGLEAPSLLTRAENVTE
jgi:putative ABC transport system substrate-binding protein